MRCELLSYFFFFQAEDGIRDIGVTGVQTCALPISLDTDPGARILGELGIGTNYGIETGTKSILLDEKIGGTVHMAIGASYPESGGVNESAVHWDLEIGRAHV